MSFEQEDLTELHEKLFQLLVLFRDVCENAGIWYSLAYGTMLGAVRHNDFIPWDGDADVVIMLPDKGRFRAAFANYKNKNGIKLKNFDTASHCLQSHDTLYFEDKCFRDAHLDIYPLVGAPSDVAEQKRFTMETFYTDRILRSKYTPIAASKKKILVSLVKVFLFFVPDRYLRKNILSRQNRYDFDKAKFLVDLTCYPKAESCIEKEVWLRTIKYVFHGEYFNIPESWDHCLTRIYGDYMTPRQY